MSELFVRLAPPAGGNARLQRTLERRAASRRRTRAVVGVVAITGVVLTSWMALPAPTIPVDGVPVATAPSLDAAKHPAIAVWQGTAPSGAELRSGPGSLRPIATETADIVLYVRDGLPSRP